VLVKPGQRPRRAVATSGPRSQPTADDLETVYREHVASIYGFFADSVGRDVAEDLTAATFERVVRYWGRFDASRSGERTWIRAIARNLLTDHRRGQLHRSGPSLDEHPTLIDGIVAREDPAQRALDAEAVNAWVSQLRPREGQVLALRYVADFSVAEIARIMELTEANVHQLSSRALRRLRDMAADRPSTDPAAIGRDSRSRAARARTSGGCPAARCDRPSTARSPRT
jgi:RNA polymerase sigma-70 factor (ECF subfamily)